MDDQGFDFRGPPGRREPKRFEPPPWEREAFKELQRVREAEEVAEAAGGLGAEAGRPEAGENDAGPGAQARGSESTTQAEEPQATRKGVSEAEVLELLAGLAEQEPDPRGPATAVTIASSVVLLPIGIVVLVWGMVAFVKAGEAVANAGIARTGAATMMIFGAGFVASAFWLMYRLMKQRGVL